ncbi:MAG: hypothetical protein GF388_00705 [Candidatus Aegiribacteria sp.]|nr:hypothetical protein [Candidatus Aegiribacteria sp.]
MKYIMLILALTIAYSVLAQDENSGSIEVVEVFWAETPEELEASLTDGYPMPWLEEILNDESIPEEDRYWLDCRVRAVIAQDLHLFFNEEGNPIRFEAGYILPGEDYWRECFIINLPGNELADNSPVGRWAGKGLVVDHFGNVIGEIAISNSDSKLSRDGTVGVTQSGIQSSNFGPGLMNLCFFYPDGSFREFPIHHYTFHETVSQSGELVVASCIDRSRSEEKIHKLYVFDGDANLLWERTLEYSPPSGLISPAISPDDRYIAVQMHQHSNKAVILLDSYTGRELQNWNGISGSHLRFSPDGNYLCMVGSGAGIIVNCETGEEIWSRNTELMNNIDARIQSTCIIDLYCTNNAQIVYWSAKQAGNTLMWTQVQNRWSSRVYEMYTNVPSFSPNGYIALGQMYRPEVVHSMNALPMQVYIVNGGE